MGIEMWAELILLGLLWAAHPTTAVDMNGLMVSVPRVVYIGQDVELECKFPGFDPSSLYSIKWWKDNDQFYQFIPKNPEPKMKFEVNGIRVDPDHSTEFKVTLKNLSLNSSGAFTCEVIWDDNFETIRKSANMTVIDPPDGDEGGKYGPIIKVRGWSGSGPLEVRDGERVEALCEAKNANPPVILTWYLNETEIGPEYVEQQVSKMVDFNLYTSSLRLVLTANRLWDEQGRALLKCAADLPDLFHASTVLELHNPVLRRARLTGVFDAGYAVKPSAILMTCAALLSLHLFQMTVLSSLL